MFTEYMARRRREDGAIVLVLVQHWDSLGPFPDAWDRTKSPGDTTARLAGLPIIDECPSMLDEPHELIQACA